MWRHRRPRWRRGGWRGGFWGEMHRGGEMRSLGAPSGDRRRPEARPTGDERPSPGSRTRIQNPVFRIWRGRCWSAGGRWNLYLCATHSPVCHTGTRASRTPGAFHHLHPPPPAHVDVLVSMVAGGCVKVSLLALLWCLWCHLQARAKGSLHPPVGSCYTCPQADSRPCFHEPRTVQLVTDVELRFRTRQTIQQCN